MSYFVVGLIALILGFQFGRIYEFSVWTTKLIAAMQH